MSQGYREALESMAPEHRRIREYWDEAWARAEVEGRAEPTREERDEYLRMSAAYLGMDWEAKPWSVPATAAKDLDDIGWANWDHILPPEPSPEDIEPMSPEDEERVPEDGYETADEGWAFIDEPTAYEPAATTSGELWL